jgi:hypothetical protein
MSESNNKEKLKAKARKLKELKDRGVGGEKTSAENKLREFLIKHNMSEEEIDGTFKQRIFKIRETDDSLIITNVILSVNPYAKIFNDKKAIIADLDDEDFIEVIQKVRYFAKLWRIEKELLTMAFFAKHGDSFKPDEYACSKYREQQKNKNEEYEKAQERANQFTEKAKELKVNIDVEKIAEQKGGIRSATAQENIKLMNLQRQNQLVPILLSSKYVRTNKTVGE